MREPEILYFEIGKNEMLRPTPDMKKIARKMAALVSGTEQASLVVHHPEDLPLVRAAAKRGRAFAGRDATVIPCALGQCHRNSAAWKVLDPESLSLVSGWWVHTSRKTRDARWTPHTWLLAKDPITGREMTLDVTMVADGRFGVVLDEQETIAHINGELSSEQINAIIAMRPKVAALLKKHGPKGMEKIGAMMARFTNKHWKRF